jgi:O-acetyl-ADP-ribose deacetylase
MPTWIIKTAHLTLRQGDICQASVDAIVNAANSMLQGGGGVDGAIHRAAGPKLLAACQAIIKARPGPLAAGQAVLTPGFDLSVRYVIHTVGPIWRGGEQGEAAQLRLAYGECLRLAAQNGCTRIAFPAISCGAYGYPLKFAAPIALAALRQDLGQGLPREAELWLHDGQTFNFWCGAASSLLGPPQLP